MNDDEVRAALRRHWDASDAGDFEAEHAIYAAHFPGNPITPGACTLQMVGELAEEVVGKPLQLSCAKNVKYLAPLTPTGTPCPTFALNIRCEGNTWLVKAEVKNNEHVFAKLSLVYE